MKPACADRSKYYWKIRTDNFTNSIMNLSMIGLLSAAVTYKSQYEQEMTEIMFRFNTWCS